LYFDYLPKIFIFLSTALRLSLENKNSDSNLTPAILFKINFFIFLHNFINIKNNF
jgi:hypothetical protein